MKKYLRFVLFIMLAMLSVPLSLRSADEIRQSYFKLTTSNGLVVAVYNAAENRIDNVYPHIFANYDSGLYVHPFTGNIKLISGEKPVKTSYLDNTHVISVEYNDFTVSYFASFTRHDRIFFIVVRGPKEIIKKLDFDAETVAGQAVSNITQLENHLQDLPITIKGKALTGNFLRKYDDQDYEKYFLFSLVDSLQPDKDLVDNTIIDLAASKTSLHDAGV